MAKKNIADKYWIYGEDADLAARLKIVIRILNLNPCAQVIHWRKVLNPS